VADVTQILEGLERGDPQAAGKLLPLVYDELKALASRQLAREKPGQTLNPTALVHEAYLRLVKVSDDPKWKGRRHFFAAAAESMRRILVENARRKAAQKRGGGRSRDGVDVDQLPHPDRSEALLEIDDALEALARADADAAELVKLRHFAGLTIKESAAVMGISARSADRLWGYARAWLLREMKAG
jgi:RNA polymerase sigma factor (TIGR02999 family)